MQEFLSPREVCVCARALHCSLKTSLLQFFGGCLLFILTTQVMLMKEFFFFFGVPFFFLEVSHGKIRRNLRSKYISKANVLNCGITRNALQTSRPQLRFVCPE